MTLYIRADEDLQWFNGSTMITSGRTVSYHNGTAGAEQNGAIITIPGRVSVLTISNPQQSDSGTYSCRILGTEQSADIQLNVMYTQPTKLPGATSPVTTPTGPGTAATHSTTTLPSSIVALQLSVIPIQQSALSVATSSATTPTGPAATPTGPGPSPRTGATHSTTTLSTGIVAVFTVVGAVILLSP